MLRKSTFLILLILTSCCIPLMGPCGQDEFRYRGINPEMAAVIKGNRKTSSDVPVFITEIKPAGNASADKLAAHANTVLVPEGNYSFLVQSYGSAKPWTLGVFCKSKLSKGHYTIRALKQKEGAFISQTVIIQDEKSGAVICRDTNSNALLPDWVSPLLQ